MRARDSKRQALRPLPVAWLATTHTERDASSLEDARVMVHIRTRTRINNRTRTCPHDKRDCLPLPRSDGDDASKRDEADTRRWERRVRKRCVNLDHLVAHHASRVLHDDRDRDLVARRDGRGGEVVLLPTAAALRLSDYLEV